MDLTRSGLLRNLSLLALALLYLAGGATTFQPADSAEFLTVAATAGIAHPSGYPLYTLLGTVFTTVLPFSVPQSLAILATVLTLLTLAGVFTLVHDLTRQPIAAFAATGVGGVSLHLWKHATHPEAFALLGTFAIWLAVVAFRAGDAERSEKERFRYACGYALLTGLATAHHFTIALTFPVGVWMLWRVFFSEARLSQRGRLLAFGVGLFAVGLLPYLHLVVRGANPPFGSWGKLTTFSEVIDHILRKEFGTFRSGLYKNAPPAGTHSWHYLKTSLAPFGSFALGLALLWMMGFSSILRRLGVLRSPKDSSEAAGPDISKKSKQEKAKSNKKTEQVSSASTETQRETLLVQFSLVLLVTWVVCGPLFHTQLQMGTRPIDLYIVGRFFVLPDVFLAVFAGLGCASLLPLLRGKETLVVVVLTFWFAGVGVAQWSHASSRHQHWLETYARDMLREVPKGALVLEEADEAVCFGVTYLQEVLKYRTDVRFVCLSFLGRKWYVERLKKRWPEFKYRWNPKLIQSVPIIYHYLKLKRPVHVTTLYNRSILKYYGWTPWGLTWQGQLPTQKRKSLEELFTRVKSHYKKFGAQKPFPDWRLSPWPALTLQRYRTPWRWFWLNSRRMGKKKLAKKAFEELREWRFPYKPVTSQKKR